MSKLPFVSSDIPRDLRQFINSVREAIGGTGDTKIVTVGDLIRSGIATTGGGGVITPPVGTVDPPTTPTNVTASGAIQNIIVTWDAPLYRGHSYAEIWGSATDNVGVAVKLGMSPGAIFVDAVGPSVTRYYWVRFVNSLGAIGAFNAVAGTQGQTGSDVNYLLQTLTGQITTSQLYTDLNTRINGIETNAAAIATEVTIRTTQTGDLYAKYGVKVDLAGHVSGYGLLSTLNNGTPFSAFGIRADQFWVAPPSFVSATAPTTDLYNGYVWVDTSVTPSVTRYRNTTTNSWVTTAPNLPFIVQATPTTINGVAVAAGVYIDTAFIRDGTITNAKIGDATIDSAKIVSLSAAKITAGEIAVGQSIASTSFVSGTQGWRIQGNGTAEFASTSIRGLLTADQIDTRDLTIKNSAGTVIFSSGGVSAAYVSGLGNFAFLNTITSANISTYIAGAAIGEAYIADAAITNAKIGDASITNGKISGYIRSDNYSAGVSGWQIDKSGSAEFHSLNITSGQVTGVFQQIVPVPLFYSGKQCNINGNTPYQTSNGQGFVDLVQTPDYTYNGNFYVGTYMYKIWEGTMPAPGTASGAKPAAVVSANILTGTGTSRDLIVLVVVYPAYSYENQLMSDGNYHSIQRMYQGETTASSGSSAPFSISVSAAGSSQISYVASVPIAIFVTGNIISGTINNVSGLFWGVR